MKRLCQTVAIVAFMVFGAIVAQPGNTQDDAFVHANRGVALLEQFRFSEASDAFAQFIALRPDDATGHINLGISLFNERDFEAALASFNSALSLSPDSAYVHYNLGLTHKLMGETERAVTAFERVAEIDPLDSMTHYYLGTLYANLGRLEDAEASLRLTLRLQPANESAHFSLGNVLIRQGRRDEGRDELMTFRELKQAFPGEASVGLQYTELGRYAEAVESSAATLQQASDEPVVGTGVRFVEATDDAGLRLPPLEAFPELSERVTQADDYPSWLQTHLLPRLGTGLSFRDLDGDGKSELLFVRDGAPLVFRNTGDRFEPLEESGLPTEGAFIGVVAGDVDNDGDSDLYLSGIGANALYLNDGSGRFEDAPSPTVRGDDVSVSASFADVDHDGDLDIYVSNYAARTFPEGESELTVPDGLPGAPNRLYRNNGDGSFTDVALETRTTGGASRSLGALFSDLDEDRDIDFIVMNDGAPALLFANDRVGTFTESRRAFRLDTSSRMRGLDSADFDRDGSFDLFLTAEGSALNNLLRGSTRDGFRSDVLSPGLLSAGSPGGRFGTSFVDADNDTDLDLLVVVNESDALLAYYDNTRGGYVRAQSLATEVAGGGRALALSDVDADGDVDAVVATNRGELVFFRNDGGNANHFVRVRAVGLRSNLDGLGAKVEIKAGPTSARREVRSASGYFSQNELPLHFGLGDSESVDYVRFLWPGGVKQIEMDVSGGVTASIEELNRKGTSCPILYAWDGERIRFVTDFLGGSAFGNLLAPGSYNSPDTNETVKMEAFPLQPKDGFYEIRFVNQLEEVIIYDQASLLVVDHPAELEVFPNERLMPHPPYPEPELYPVENITAPVRALDGRGNDVTSLVVERDRLYPDDFALLPFKGYAETHSLSLDLGDLDDDGDYVLLLYGWVDYADSSSNLAASQSGTTVVTPYLEVGDGSGAFTEALPEMGFPAGLPKTMIVDLGDLVDSDKHWVRITTSMRLYWDQIRVAKRVDSERIRTTELLPDEARLGFLGYPEAHDPDGRAPSLYTYDRIRSTELWGTHEGYYTRYGDVRPLVSEIDDAYVITHHGDELRMRFAEKHLPPLPSGWKRSFMAFADGFGKDMDLNSARPNRVQPLPFHSMSGYPYPADESFPTSDLHRELNDRYVGPEHASPFHTPNARVTEPQ